MLLLLATLTLAAQPAILESPLRIKKTLEDALTTAGATPLFRNAGN